MMEIFWILESKIAVNSEIILILETSRFLIVSMFIALQSNGDKGFEYESGEGEAAIEAKDYNN